MIRAGELLEEPTGHRSGAELEERAQLEADVETFEARQRRAFLSILERIARLETRLGEIARRLDGVERELVQARKGRTRGGS